MAALLALLASLEASTLSLSLSSRSHRSVHLWHTTTHGDRYGIWYVGRCVGFFVCLSVCPTNLVERLNSRFFRLPQRQHYIVQETHVHWWQCSGVPRCPTTALIVFIHSINQSINQSPALREEHLGWYMQRDKFFKTISSYEKGGGNEI